MTLTVAANKATAICRKLNIPTGKIVGVTVNHRARKRWGLCKRYVDGTFGIEVAECLTDGEHDYALVNTLIHEMIHTAPKCQNHGEKWSEYADRVSKATEYKIKRSSSYEEMGFAPDAIKAKYRFKCAKCGAIVNRNRMSDFVRNPYNYMHKECGGGKWIRMYSFLISSAKQRKTQRRSPFRLVESSIMYAVQVKSS